MKSRTFVHHPRQRVEVFTALGHPDRLHIVGDLAAGERCVFELVDSVGSVWSTVSRCLSVLKQAGIVTDEKRGPQVFYRLALPRVPSFMTGRFSPQRARGPSSPANATTPRNCSPKFFLHECQQSQMLL